ncbi:MAG: GNAT family N-acetyltransferase [Methanotrichaceae archaeon]|nr:GNAT family N-acetyltransferase [Methanotrichaceae archaeon]
MSQSLCTKLSLPADERFLLLIQAHIREIAGVALLPHKDVLGLELAVEEAFKNTIEHAYPDDRSGDVFLDIEIRPMELIISMRDEGLPFDPSMEKDAIRTTMEGEMPLHGFGLKIIRHEVDEARFENLGQRGKTLRLVKRLHQPIEIQPEKVAHEIEMAPRQNYEIRPIRPEEAIQVPKLFWLAYGYSYRSEFYKPEYLTHMVESGRIISYVAVAENGEVVGHIGLIRQEPLPIAEEAFLAVAPAHRGHGIMDALSVAIEARALEMGLLGISANAVTSHDISQKEVTNRGYKSCGFELSAYLHLQFKALVKENCIPQRESLMHCFKYISSPPPVVAHVPPRHRDIVGRIYENLGQTYRLGDPAPSSSLGDYEINFDRNLQKGLIKVISADQNQWPVMLRATEDLEKFGGAEAVNLDLPLAQPASALICELAEKAGFFFSCVRPSEAQDGDYLRLQRLTVPLDTNRLCIHSDFGRELFDYVTTQMGAAQI